MLAVPNAGALSESGLGCSASFYELAATAIGS
jgi:hypothetical protein